MEDKVKLIWENFDKHLRGLICTKMNNHNECLDVLQDVYLKIIKNIDKISSVENVPSYLNRLASNAVTDYYRQEIKKSEIGKDNFESIVIIDEVSGEQDQLKNCQLECLDPGINMLPEIYKEALILSDIEGMPQKEVAEKLGITLSGAKSRVQRARERLKEAVMECCYKKLP